MSERKRYGKFEMVNGAIINTAYDKIERLQSELEQYDDFVVCDCCYCLTDDPVDAGGHVQCQSCTKLAEYEDQDV